jgi:hypothetical protein
MSNRKRKFKGNTQPSRFRMLNARWICEIGPDGEGCRFQTAFDEIGKQP